MLEAAVCVSYEVSPALAETYANTYAGGNLIQDVLEIAQRKIAVAINEQDHEIATELERINAEAAAKGYFRSGRLIIERDRACAEAIKRRGAFVWEILHRCITTGRIGLSADLAQQLKMFALPYLVNDVGALALRVNLGMERSGLKPIPPTISERARDNARSWLESEIDLFCHVLSQAPQHAEYNPQPVINIHGSTVGAVQTGDQSTATVRIIAPTASYHAAARHALEELKREIQAVDQGQDSPSLFLIEASSAELDKPMPDKSRLASLIAATKSCLAGVIDTAPKIPAAIEAVQKAISLLPFGSAGSS